MSKRQQIKVLNRLMTMLKRHRRELKERLPQRR